MEKNMSQPEKTGSAGASLPQVKASSQASTIVALAMERQAGGGAELFHDKSGVAYATVNIDGVLKTMPVRSKVYRDMLRRDLHLKDGRNASSQAIDDALGTIEGMAMFDGRECEINLRTAECDSEAYIDLGNNEWQSVRVTSDGWDVISNPNVKWRRPSSLRPLATPVHNGDWRLLFDVFPLPFDYQVLVVSWLVMALSPKGPYPLLILQGEQGTGKSELSKLLRRIVDNNEALIRTIPKCEQDLLVSAKNNWVIALDNLSGMQPWLSDALCRLATGGGFAARALYSNDDEIIINAERPIIINGIDDLATRQDLAGRALILNLEPIPEDKRIPREEMQAKADEYMPQIMGALLDAVSMAMRMLPTTNPNELPRMADFAKRIIAAEPALWERGTFERVFRKAADDVIAAGLEASPVAQAITKLMASHSRWSGTATELLNTLSELVDDKTKGLRIWPKVARTMADSVRRIAPALRHDGLDIEFRHEKSRLIIITHLDSKGISASKSSFASKPLCHNGFSVNDLPTQNDLPTITDEAPTIYRRKANAEKPESFNVTDDTDANDAKIPLLSNPEVEQPSNGNTTNNSRVIIRDVSKGDKSSNDDSNKPPKWRF